MDTRTKLIAPQHLPDLLRSGSWRLVVSTFDPFTVETADRLAGLQTADTRLLLIVEPGNDPLLAQDARGLLLAALRSVDAVCLSNGDGWRHLVANAEVVDEREHDAARVARFVEFVCKRQEPSPPAKASGG